MEATGLTMAERLTSSCHATHARSSQEASHVLRRTRCSSKVCLQRDLAPPVEDGDGDRSEEHTSELQSRLHLVCRLLLEKKKHPHYTTSTKHPSDPPA